MKSLATALRVMRLFTRVRSSWSVTDVCEETGLNKSLVSKILSEFRDAGILDRNPVTRKYTVAQIAVALAGNFIKSNALCSEALGPMRRLVNSFDQTVTLCVMVGNEVMYLLSVEGPPFIDHGWRVGGWIPFHCTAAGKVLVAALPEAEIDEMIEATGLPRYTPTTICDRAVLKTRLDEVRATGIAVTHSEGTPGLGALAVPVLGEGQRVIAALGAVYPEHLVTAADRANYVIGLHNAAQQLSYKLGARVYPFGGRNSVGSKKGRRSSGRSVLVDRK